MSRASRLGKNTGLVFIGKLGSSIIGFIMLPLYTRWLGVENFGISDMISVYASFLLILVTCGISESIFIFPKDKDKQTQTAYFSSALSFILGMFFLTGLIFCLVQILTDIFDIFNSFTDNIWLIYIILTTTALQQFFQQFTRSIDKMLVFGFTGIVNTACIAFFAFLFIPYFGLVGYVVSLAFAALISGIYSFIASKSYEYINIKSATRSLAKEMLKYSIPLMPNGMMWWLVNSLNRPLMEHNLSMHDIGIYAVANKFPSILTLVFGIFSTSWQISVLEEFDKTGYKEFYNKIFKLVFCLLLFILLVITLCSKFIVIIFASNDFYDAWHYIPLLTLGALFSSISSFCGTNFSATRESKYFFYSSVWGAISSIIFNVLLIPLMGVYGVCVAFVLSFAVMSGCRLYYSWRYTPIDHPMVYASLLLTITIIVILYILDIQTFGTICLSIILLGYLLYCNRTELLMITKFVKSKFEKQ